MESGGGVRTREEAVQLIHAQLHWKTGRKKVGQAHHYGRQELRALLDFLYGGPPSNVKQQINSNED